MAECPRCSIGTPIFKTACIVCCTVNDAIAALLKELVSRNQAMRAQLMAISKIASGEDQVADSDHEAMSIIYFGTRDFLATLDTSVSERS